MVTKTVSPYDLFFEPDVVHEKDSQWIAVRTYESKEALKEAYPDFAEEIDAHASTGDSTEYGSEHLPEDRAEVFEVYWRNGRHAVMVGDTYLYQDDEYPVPAFPVQILKYTHVPRRLWGMSLLTPLVDLQWLYNKSRSQLLTNVELMSNPKWLVPKTAGLAKSAITNRPGEKIFYNAAGGKPQQVQGVPMPQYVLDNIQRLQMELLDVSGVHNISLGKREIGVTSGKAIQALAAQDSSQLHVTQMRIEQSVQTLAKTVLLLMKAFYKEAKMVRMLDSTGQVVFDQIQDTDLVEDPEVFIQTGSLFRDEAHDRDAKIMEMAQLGLIEKEVAMQELSFRTGNAFVTEQVVAIAHAREMLEACKRGMQIEIFRSDDLRSFAKVFGEFMRTKDYYKLTLELQDYVRDVFVAVSTANLPPEEAAIMSEQDKVFPRKPKAAASPEEKAAVAIAPDSAIAQQQMLQAVVEQDRDVAAIAAGGQVAADAGVPLPPSLPRP